IDEFLDQLRVELGSLNDEVILVESEAAEAERRAQDSLYRSDINDWAMQHLTVYLDGLTSTTRRELRQDLDEALGNAAARRAKAKAEAEHIVASARAELGLAAIDRAMDGPAPHAALASPPPSPFEPVSGPLASLVAVLDSMEARRRPN